MLSSRPADDIPFQECHRHYGHDHQSWKPESAGMGVGPAMIFKERMKYVYKCNSCTVKQNRYRLTAHSPCNSSTVQALRSPHSRVQTREHCWAALGKHIAMYAEIVYKRISSGTVWHLIHNFLQKCRGSSVVQAIVWIFLPEWHFVIKDVVVYELGAQIHPNKVLDQAY